MACAGTCGGSPTTSNEELPICTPGHHWPVALCTGGYERRLPGMTMPNKDMTSPPPPAWDPKPSTLIFGARDAVLVDALLTVREATALADWIALHDRRLTTIYITHGHGDHYGGLPV